MRELEKVSIKKYGNVPEITSRLPWFNTEPVAPRKPLKYDLHLKAQAEAVKRRKAIKARMKHRAVELRLKGKSVKTIARSLAMSPVTIYSSLKQHRESLKG